MSAQDSFSVQVQNTNTILNPLPIESSNKNIAMKLYKFNTLKGTRMCLRIQAPKRQSRQPVHFTLLLDTSGSMNEENRLKNVKWSLKHLIKFLTPDDQLSLVDFNDYSIIHMNRQPMTLENKQKIDHIIDRIEPNGGTNLSSSIVTSRDCLYLNSDGICHMKQGIVLLTDGYANQGIVNSGELMHILKRVVQDSNGASVTCIGYGVNHNAELLRNLATEGGGAYNVVQNLEDVAEIFADIIGGLLTCSYQQVEVVVPGSHNKSTLGTHYSVNQGDEQTQILLGDLHSENEVVIILPENIKNIIIKGFDLQTMASVKYELSENNTDITDSDLSVGFATFYRQETAQLIDNVRREISNSNITYDYDIIRDSILSLRRHIEDAKNLYPHSLYELLLEEILEIEIVLATVREYHSTGQMSATQVAHETSQVLSQHSAFISLGRGVRSHFTPVTPSLRQLSRHVSENPQLHSTFSNSVQRHISHELTSQIESDNFVDLPPSPPPPPPPHVEPLTSLLPSLPPPPPLIRRIQREVAVVHQIPANIHNNINFHDIPTWVPVSPTLLSSQSTD